MMNCELWEGKVWWRLQHVGQGAQGSTAQVPAHSGVKCWAWQGQWFSTQGLQNLKWSVNSFPKGLQKDKSEKCRLYLLYFCSNLQTKESWGHYASRLILTRTEGKINERFKAMENPQELKVDAQATEQKAFTSTETRKKDWNSMS